MVAQVVPKALLGQCLLRWHWSGDLGEVVEQPCENQRAGAGETVPGRGHSKCKGPGVRTSWMSVRNRKQVSMT